MLEEFDPPAVYAPFTNEAYAQTLEEVLDATTASSRWPQMQHVQGVRRLYFVKSRRVFNNLLASYKLAIPATNPVQR